MSWLIIGGGVSGLGAAKFLVKKGNHSVRVSEGKTLSPAAAAAFHSLGVKVLDGGHALSHLDGISNVVLSPGLPPSHLLVEAARAKGLPLISEIDLALQHLNRPVIGVTGTNGKSTTCAMIGHVLTSAGMHVSVGGNFGDPPTAMLAEDRMGDVLVLELSSYQLEQSNLLRPKAAVFTSFSHDHMARHGSLEAYFAAKWRLFEQMTKADIAVMPPYIFDLAQQHGLSTKAQVITDFSAIYALNLKSYGVGEVHNQLNAAFALLSSQSLAGRSAEALASNLVGFRGLPHRCELIGTIAGKKVFNDSKSTNVESTIIALQSQDDPVLLFMGGQGKNEPYAPLLDERQRIAALVTFGASGQEIAAALSQRIPTYSFPTLKAALQSWKSLPIEQVGTVLFSPGCASFDEFDNYGHRGDEFRAQMITNGMKSIN